MSSPYDRRGAQARRGNISYWLPLAFTVTAAAVGVVAWIWSTRSDEDDDDDDDENRPLQPPRPEYGERNPDGSFRTGPPSYAGDMRPGEASFGTTDQQPSHPSRSEESQGYIAQMSGALQRTPSPQQFINSASRSLAAGAAAVGGVVGSALSSIREEDKHGFDDHRTWQEESVIRRNAAPSPPITTTTAPAPVSGPIELRSESAAGVSAAPRTPVSNGKRKTVAIVVSAESHDDDTASEAGYHHEYASILSHLPRKTDFSKIRLFVLIYAPGLTEHPLDAAGGRPGGSLSSSFSNISPGDVHTPGEESDRQLTPMFPPRPSAPLAFGPIYNEALGLVEKETMVLPFTTPTGHVHILRHLAPEFIYLQESLAGENGSVINHLQSWFREDVVLIVGADGGHGGLADSESEAESQVSRKREQWWEREDRVGLGRGVVVIEGNRIGDFWARKVLGVE
ncbi:uncharacterized protein EAF02_010202 [Botrytis sinoallii]|uniref:uncharacterized protein n=1 Tax=Botrytis sinoallii TaxID=1463999 RepID=UPI001901B1D2|nr:uncharacterized protein EAF02_010202 [Botrytis sinoallii]KAF7864234.1 hypothetical protein EAF02_010202 [Botrytis sinoallii]